MAPLLPSESAAYAVALPDELEDDRLNLKIRTGAATCYTRSTVVVHGGLTVGIGLPKITVHEIEAHLLEVLGPNKDWLHYLSNEIFYLSIINRKWNRVDLGMDGDKPAPRLYHSLTFHGNSIYLFGGLVLVDRNRFAPANDLWAFHLDTNVWECLDDGSSSGTICRYDHTILPVDYKSPFDEETHRGIAITGGRGELDRELMHITIYDLAKEKYLNNTEIQLTLNELRPRENSAFSAVDPQSAPASSSGARAKLKVTTGMSCVISGSSSLETDINQRDDTLYIFNQDGYHDEQVRNPLISLPVAPNASGIRLPMSQSTLKNTATIPRALKNPTGGIFGNNIIISGQKAFTNEYQVFLYNRPSQKWTRLNIDTKLKAKDMYLWKSFSWHSHHKVLVIGSAVFPEGAEFATIQKFDLLVLVGLPISNLFHAFTVPEAGPSDKTFAPKVTSLKETTSFEAYSKYIAPQSKISSIRSVFPSYAVTLGRNAFERYGSSLADFEFITADGDKINVPLMLLRKRWGRCFDMLLAKAYARAVYKLESTKDDEDEETRSVLSSTQQSKKSTMVINKAAQAERQASEAPQFRLPFQDKSSSTLAPSPGPLGSSVPTSRKASVVSTSGASVMTTSTTDLPDGPDLSSIPPAPPAPSEPLPPLSMLKNVGSRDYLRDSPRGSISGASIATSTNSGPVSAAAAAAAVSSQTIKLKDLRTPVNQLKKRGTSRSSSVQNNPGHTEDGGSVHESHFDSIHAESFDESKNLLEPLLIPRSLYLPFSTSTVQAITEFLFVGKLGDKWLLFPTTTDTFLVAKFYELPLLYDLISEALYAILGKKEDALMKGYGRLLEDYQKKLKLIFQGDDSKVEEFFAEHPHVRESFQEIEMYLNTVDDGYLNLSLLRKTAKGSGQASTLGSSKGSVDMTRRRSSARARVGKSSLSKEVKADDDDNDEAEPLDDIENEDEEFDDEPVEPVARASSSEPIKFRTDSMSMKKSGRGDDDDDIDPITPLNTRGAKVVENAIDDDDPLSTTSAPQKSSSESEPAIQMPEGRFTFSKDDADLMKTKTTDSGSSTNNKTTTTSDSDDMAVGLGLATNLKLKEKKKRSAELEQDDDLDDSEVNLPTLENLASPNSPEPHDHIIQVVYEAAALACDMKLLLRSVNALEMSKFFSQKKEELLKELDVYGIKYHEDKERVVREAREREERERLQREQEERERLQREQEERERLQREQDQREREAILRMEELQRQLAQSQIAGSDREFSVPMSQIPSNIPGTAGYIPYAESYRSDPSAGSVRSASGSQGQKFTSPLETLPLTPQKFIRAAPSSGNIKSQETASSFDKSSNSNASNNSDVESKLSTKKSGFFKSMFGGRKKKPEKQSNVVEMKFRIKGLNEKNSDDSLGD